MVLGREGAVTVYVNGTEITSYTDINIKKRLNEIDTFTFDAYIEDNADRALIQEGNNVLILEDTDLLFKGRLQEVNYKSSFKAECEGVGMSVLLLNRKTNRTEYSNTAADQIVTSEVPTSIINHGTIESAPIVSLRFDHDNKARAVGGAANAVGYDWYIGHTGTNYGTDELNFVERKGSSTSQATLNIGETAQLIERDKDDGFVANDITLLGRGDGINQLESRVFAASTHYTDSTQVITETETGSFTVADTSQLGSTGDNLIVRVGSEVFDVNITDGTTLSINSRGLDDYNGDSTEQIQHYNGVRIWLRENVTQSIGPFTPDNPEAGSSIDTEYIEERLTDRTIIDKSTLEKVADLELKNRFEDIFRIEVRPSDPRITQSLELGDTITVEDVTAMDVSDEFRIVGFDIKRFSSEEGTVIHCANRPRRLTERLSDLERDTDTLNAHMQGATNIDSQNFSDNCDESNPLNSAVYIPEDAVAVNKMDLTFKRESFRGYVQNSDHSHSVTIPAHDHDVTIPDHDHLVDTDAPSAAGDADSTNPTGSFYGSMDDNDTFSDTIEVETVSGDAPVIIAYMTVQSKADNSTFCAGEVKIRNNSSGDTLHDDGDTSGTPSYDPGDQNFYMVTQAGDGDLENDDIEFEFDMTFDDGSNHDMLFDYGIISLGDHSHGISTTTNSGGGTTQTTTQASSTQDTTGNAGAPVYGIFEPSTEENIDVDVIVDGTTVTTVTDISVGEEVSNVISLKDDLSEPISGAWHDIQLVPKQRSGGSEGGRSRLNANVFSKVFIESKL